MPVYLEAVERLAARLKGEVIVRAPGTGPFSLASLDMISPDMYREWVHPYEVRFFSEINAYRPEKLCGSLLHICGDTTKILDLMADTGATIIEIDSKVDMAEAARIVNGRACLMGNVEPSAVMLQGSPEQVEAASRRVIADTGGKGLILGSGCEVPPATPLENIRAMIRTARSCAYPLDLQALS